MILAMTMLAALGCSESTQATELGQSVDQRAEFLQSTGNEADDELIDALAAVLSLDAYGPDVNRCAAWLTVTRIGGDDLRALDWTPETVGAAGFNPYVGLGDDQLEVVSTAWVECVDPVQLTLDIVQLTDGNADRGCIGEALGPNQTETVLASFPTDPGYDGGLGVADALLVCVEPVDLVTALWVSAGRWYTGGRSAATIQAENADTACVEGWLGDDPQGRARTLFELIERYRWVDDPVPLIDQLDRLNDGLTTGSLPADSLDELDACFSR